MKLFVLTSWLLLVCASTSGEKLDGGIFDPSLSLSYNASAGAAVDEAVNNIADVLLRRNVLLSLDDITKHLVQLSYADIIWNKYWNMQYWPSSPAEVTIEIEPVIRGRTARGIVSHETRQIVYRTITRCANPSSQPIACPIPSFNYTIDQEIHMTAIEGVRQPEPVELPVTIWSETIERPYGWNWLLSEEDILLQGEALLNIQPSTQETVPPHHLLRVETEVEKIVITGEMVADLIIGSKTSDILEWFVTGCAVPYESSNACRLHKIGPFAPSVVSAQLSPTAKAALCVHRDLSRCLITLGDDGKLHSAVRSTFVAVPSSRIHRRIWYEQEGRSDWLAGASETYTSSRPIKEVTAIV